MKPDTAPDVVVVGGGIMGCSAAFFLAKAGAKVTLVERAEQVGTEASGRNGGGIRANGRKPAEVPLALASIRLWEAFRDEYGGQFEYDQDGQMFFARNEDELASLRRAEPILQGLGVTTRVVTGPDLREIVPHVSPMVIGGLYAPRDGYANPILATRFVGRLAAKTGARVLTNTAVTGLRERDGRITELITNNGRIPCGRVVSTVGPWANDIAGMVGVTLPIHIQPTRACVTTPVGKLTTPMISGNSVWIRPTHAGNLVYGGGSVDPGDGFDKRSNLNAIRWASARAVEVLPDLQRASVLRSWAGTLVNSPDHMMIIDDMPGVENMLFATGCTGHGFCMGPIVGKLLSERVLGLTPSLPMEGLVLSRFGPIGRSATTA